MDEKRPIDAFGAIALTGFSALLAFNQVVIKLTAEGLSPVFQAGLRSLGAILVLGIWLWLRGIRFRLPPGALYWGILSGVLFGFEFLCLFHALDLTTVGRASVIFYTMPVWLALAAHFLLPGERLSGIRVAGMALAVTGVAVALLDRSTGEASLTGDVLALIATFGWAGIALLVRLTPLSQVPPVGQMLFQVVVSAPILLIAAPLFGPLIRDVTALTYAGMVFQIFATASFGFLFWFWLIGIYHAASVASFAFLSPVLAVLFGWAILGEQLSWGIGAALIMVVLGLLLINRK